MRRVAYRSKNRYRTFLAAAKTVARKISQIDGVIGILATGGIGRGHCDYYSDLDLIVYADEPRVRDLDRMIAVGYLRYKDIELDTPVESYQRALSKKSPSQYWSQVMRWDRANSQILFDTDGRIERLLKAKLVFPDWERKKLLKEHSRSLTEHLIYNFEMWENRGTVLNLSHTLIQAAEHLILWIYAANRTFQPYVPKWLFYHLENGFVPEARYLSIIKKPYLRQPRNVTEAQALRDELIRLAQNLGVEFDFKSVAQVFAEDDENWKKAPEKTRYYLSW